jgi:hypothetical protein
VVTGLGNGLLVGDNVGACVGPTVGFFTALVVGVFDGFICGRAVEGRTVVAAAVGTTVMGAPTEILSGPDDGLNHGELVIGVSVGPVDAKT